MSSEIRANLEEVSTKVTAVALPLDAMEPTAGGALSVSSTAPGMKDWVDRYEKLEALMVKVHTLFDNDLQTVTSGVHELRVADAQAARQIEAGQ